MSKAQVMERLFGAEPAFMPFEAPLAQPATSVSLLERYMGGDPEEFNKLIRGEYADPAEAFNKLVMHVNRGITSTMTAFPVRENLDGEVHILTPVETPLRNRLPRTPGAGTAIAWKQQTAFGAGLGTQTTTSGTTNTVNTLTVANAQGFFAGETITYASATHTISSVNYTTNVITVGASPGVLVNSQTNGQTVVKSSLYFPETAVADQIFYSETGAPSESTTVYANKTGSYKLLGTMGYVTMFAAASGKNFQDQYAVEKRNTLTRLLIKEEFSLLWGRTDSVLAPWGDGTTNMAYLGLIPWINANVPATQIQSSVGALTDLHLQQQLTRIWYNGGRSLYIMLAGQEAISLMRLVESTGNYRVNIISQAAAKLGGKVGSIIHAVSGEEVPIFVHTMLPPGTIVFGADRNAYGQSTAEVSVLPQANMPESVDQDTQASPFAGYYAQDLAPAAATPEKLSFIAKVYQVPEWKNAQVFAISTGVTAVS